MRFAGIDAASSPSGFAIGEQWVDHDPAFASQCGTELDAANVRRAFRTVAADADPQGAVAVACATSSTSQPIASGSRACRLDHPRDRRPDTGRIPAEDAPLLGGLVRPVAAQRAQTPPPCSIP